MKAMTTIVAIVEGIFISLFFICFFPLGAVAAPPEKDICPAPESQSDRRAAVKAACNYFNKDVKSWGLHSAFGPDGEVITCIHFSCEASSPTAKLKAPTLLSPAGGKKFSHYPRKTTLKWKPVSGAISYTVEMDCYNCCKSGKWCRDVGKKWKIEKGLTTTSYTFNFVGAQPGRWRVWAVDKFGKSGYASKWREFSYTK